MPALLAAILVRFFQFLSALFSIKFAPVSDLNVFAFVSECKRINMTQKIGSFLGENLGLGIDKMAQPVGESTCRT